MRRPSSQPAPARLPPCTTPPAVALRLSVASVLLISHLCLAAHFDVSSLARSYALVLGRRTACPRSVSIASVSSGPFISAHAVSASGHACHGPGGTAVRDGATLLASGLVLPSLVTAGDVTFFAGVETAPRTCGRWAFNASAISWFVYKPRGRALRSSDTASGLQVEPGFVYVTYEHFADFCAYRAQVPEQVVVPSPEAVVAEGGGEAETVSAEEPASDSPDRVCFPADATVQLPGGRVKRMDELQIGDRVLSSTRGEFSDVYFFSHRQKHVSALFVRLDLASKRSLSLSSGHFIYINGVITAAGKARVGDVVSKGNGATERIVAVRFVRGKGLYNPHTRISDIVVNDVLTTTWTTAVPPTVAQSLLSPIRLHYDIQPQWVHELIGKWLRWLLKRFQQTSDESKSIREL